MISMFRIALLLLALLPTFHAQAQIRIDPAYEEDARKARALLLKAVKFYQEYGDDALSVFSRQGEFIDGPLYVYVVDTKGVMLASGGPSVILVGRDISKTLDDDVKEAFARALDEPEGQVHDGEYRWVNWSDGRVERKHTFYQRVGDRVIAVGYYLPRSSPAQARDLLDLALQEVERAPQETFSAINQLDPRFLRDDLYVFVVDLASKRFVAHGYDRRLIGRDFQSLRAPDGKHIGQAMLDAIKATGEGEYEYLWRNPATNRNEHKHAYLRKVGSYLVAVGYYSRRA